MPVLEYFIVAESCSIDQISNRFSIFNVAEEGRMTVPGQIRELFALCAWIAEPQEFGEDLQLRLRITPPGGDMVESPHNFRMTRRRHRVALNIRNIPITEHGELLIELLLNNDHQAFHRIDILPPDEVEAQPPQPDDAAGAEAE